MKPEALIHICCVCGREGEPDGTWHTCAASRRTGRSDITHGICRDCIRARYPEYADSIREPEQCEA